jgi:Zn-dependent membrane protease YugP
VRRGWIGQVIFWGVNLGLLVFVIGLIVGTVELKRIGAPLMGVTLLVALAVLAYTAFREPLDASEADLEPA